MPALRGGFVKIDDGAGDDGIPGVQIDEGIPGVRPQGFLRRRDHLSRPLLLEDDGATEVSQGQNNLSGVWKKIGQKNGKADDSPVLWPSQNVTSLPVKVDPEKARKIPQLKANRLDDIMHSRAKELLSEMSQNTYLKSAAVAARTRPKQDSSKQENQPLPAENQPLPAENSPNNYLKDEATWEAFQGGNTDHENFLQQQDGKEEWVSFGYTPSPTASAHDVPEEVSDDSSNSEHLEMEEAGIQLDCPLSSVSNTSIRSRDLAGAGNEENTPSPTASTHDVPEEVSDDSSYSEHLEMEEAGIQLDCPLSSMSNTSIRSRDLVGGGNEENDSCKDDEGYPANEEAGNETSQQCHPDQITSEESVQGTPSTRPSMEPQTTEEELHPKDDVAEEAKSPTVDLLEDESSTIIPESSPVEHESAEVVNSSPSQHPMVQQDSTPCDDNILHSISNDLTEESLVETPRELLSVAQFTASPSYAKSVAAPLPRMSDMKKMMDGANAALKGANYERAPTNDDTVEPEGPLVGQPTHHGEDVAAIEEEANDPPNKENTDRRPSFSKARKHVRRQNSIHFRTKLSPSLHSRSILDSMSDFQSEVASALFQKDITASTGFRSSMWNDKHLIVDTGSVHSGSISTLTFEHKKQPPGRSRDGNSDSIEEMGKDEIEEERQVISPSNSQEDSTDCDNVDSHSLPLGASVEEIQMLNSFVSVAADDIRSSNLTMEDREKIHDKSLGAGLPEEFVNMILDQSAGIASWEQHSVDSETCSEAASDLMSLKTKSSSISYMSHGTKYTKDSESVSCYTDETARKTPKTEIAGGYGCYSNLKTYFWMESNQTGQEMMENVAAVISADSDSFDLGTTRISE